MILLIVGIVFSVFAYGLVAGTTYAKVLSTNKRNCRKCNSQSGYYYCSDEHEAVAFGISALWPLLLPMFIGVNFSTTTKDERRRNKEIEEAKHQAELAEILEQENRALDRALGETTTKRYRWTQDGTMYETGDYD